MGEEVVVWPEVMEVGLADRAVATVIPEHPVEVMVQEQVEVTEEVVTVIPEHLVEVMV